MVLKLILSIVGISAGFITLTGLLCKWIDVLRKENKSLKAQLKQVANTAVNISKIEQEEAANVKKIKESSKEELVSSASNLFP